MGMQLPAKIVVFAGVLAGAAVMPSSLRAGGPWRLAPGAAIELATVEQGCTALAARDAYLEEMGPVERMLRMQSTDAVSKHEIVEHAQQQVLAFTAEEEMRLDAAIVPLAGKLAQWKLPWPAKIVLVKTTGREEANAAYCRGPAIVLPERRLGDKPEKFERLLAHELFHVLSSHNPELRRKLYAVVGFVPCNPVELPGDLEARRITNPDAPRRDCRLRLEWDGAPTDVVPVLFAKHDRFDPDQGKALFDYLMFRLMVVHEVRGQWVAELRDGKPLLLQVSQVPSYYDHIGRNTDYIIHPEEVLADNFVLLVLGDDKVKSPEILTGMRAALEK